MKDDSIDLSESRMKMYVPIPLTHNYLFLSSPPVPSRCDKNPWNRLGR